MSRKLLQNLFIIPLALSPVVVSVACGKNTSNDDQAQDDNLQEINFEISGNTFKYNFYADDYLQFIPEQKAIGDKKTEITEKELLIFLNNKKGEEVDIINQRGNDEVLTFTVPLEGFSTMDEYRSWISSNGIGGNLGWLWITDTNDLVIQSDYSKWRAGTIEFIKIFMKNLKSARRDSFDITVLSLPTKTIDITNIDASEIEALTKEELIQLLSA